MLGEIGVVPIRIGLPITDDPKGLRAFDDNRLCRQSAIHQEGLAYTGGSALDALGLDDEREIAKPKCE